MNLQTKHSSADQKEGTARKRWLNDIKEDYRRMCDGGQKRVKAVNCRCHVPRKFVKGRRFIAPSLSICLTR